MAIRHDSGIVLRSYPFGESDRVVVLLSPDHGKLRTVAKGVRKTTSRFGGRLEPFTHVDVVLYEGRNLDTITQVETRRVFPRLRSDLGRVGAASTMVEAADAVAQEGEPSHALFDLLAGGLAAVDTMDAVGEAVTAFLLHLVDVTGLGLALEFCASCGSVEGLDRFSFAAGGVICGRCRPDGSVKLRSGLVEHLRVLASTPVADLSAMSSDYAGDAMGVVRRFVEYHLDRRLVSLAVLDG